MSTPDFVCLGMQKCGTTTLHAILRKHPDVVLCRDVKEPMYYRSPLPLIDTLGLHEKYYRKRYFGHVPAGDPRKKGEINAGLTYASCARKVARDFSPDVKLIFMLREPVARSYSAYKYFLARGFLPGKFLKYDREHGHAKGFDYYVHAILDDKKKRNAIMKKRLTYLVFSQSNYGSLVEEYLQYFSKEQMYFICFEEFIKDQAAACEKLFPFLDLDVLPQEDLDYTVRANEGNERAKSAASALKMYWIKGFYLCFHDIWATKYWCAPIYRAYVGFYEKSKKKHFEADPDTSKVLPQTREYLNQYFQDEKIKLTNLTGKNWWV